MHIPINKPFVLASASMRRQHLLRQIGISFEISVSEFDEVFDPMKSPENNVESLAIQKAVVVAARYANAIVLGADTTVVLDHQVLNKPNDRDDAIRMLRSLSGRRHTVVTGISLVDRPSNLKTSAIERTSVSFRKLMDDEIEEYVDSGSPMDKAGAYGIQDDYGATFVEHIEGCFYNVIGLPIARFYQLLKEFQQQFD